MLFCIKLERFLPGKEGKGQGYLQGRTAKMLPVCVCKL